MKREEGLGEKEEEEEVSLNSLLPTNYEHTPSNNNVVITWSNIKRKN